MKKICCVLALCLLLTACGKKEAPASSAPAVSSAPPVVEQEPLVLESLTVEFLRGSADAAVLMQAVKELPGQLQAALEEAGVTVEEVSVTMSGSCATTAQAVAEGGADLAFLPVEELVRAEAYPHVLLVAGEERAYLYAANTDYGKNLAKRDAPTWTELDHGRWGVAGGEAAELWLSDNYEGNGLGDLAAVTEYESYEALYAAAKAGEVDLFMAAEELADYGLLAETEPFYAYAAVVREDLADGRFSEALLSALDTLQRGDFAALFGPGPYQAGAEEDLDPQRRLASLIG